MMREDYKNDWVTASLVDDLNYLKTGVEEYEGNKDYYSTGSIKDDSIISEGAHTYNGRPSRANRVGRIGDILQARMKDTDKAVFITNELNDQLFSTGFFQIRTDSRTILPKYLFHYFKSIVFLNQKDSNCSGSTQSALNDKSAKNLFVPIAPIPVQRQIVSKIEELFSDLDKGIADLKKAQDQLKVYRQAVLKKAFEGKLTKEWREQQSDLPNADEVLEQIKEERQIHYEQQIENWKQAVKAWEENGKEGKKPGKPKKLKYFDISVDVYGKLPESYKQFTWFSLGNLFIESPQNGLYEPASKYGSGTSIIRIDSFYDGHILNNEEFKRVELSKSDIKRYSLNENEILVNRVNSIEYLGKCGLVKQLNETTVFESNIMRLKILNSCINSQYITLFLSSVLGEREIRRFAKHAVNQASINQTDVSLTPIPICTLEEQEQVVKEVSTCLSVCDKVEESITEV
jgi:type I restriction enzyme S subunit